MSKLTIKKGNYPTLVPRSRIREIVLSVYAKNQKITNTDASSYVNVIVTKKAWAKPSAAQKK